MLIKLKNPFNNHLAKNLHDKQLKDAKENELEERTKIRFRFVNHGKCDISCRLLSPQIATTELCQIRT